MNRLFFTILLGLIIPLLSFANTKSAHLVAASSQYFTHTAVAALQVIDGETICWDYDHTDNDDNVTIYRDRLDATNDTSLTPGEPQTNPGIDIGIDGNWVRASDTSLDGNWNRMCVTFQTGITGVWQNGSLSSYSVTASQPTAPGNTINICSHHAAGVLCNGDFDNLMFFNTVLSTSTIETYATCELVGTEDNLVAYYQFEGDATDSTGPNDLTAVNTPTYTTAIPSYITGSCGGAAAPPPSIESDFIIFSLLWLRDDRIYLYSGGRKILI